MEGPSLYLAREQLRPFRKQRVAAVEGNTSIEKERFQGKVLKDIFCWGKHLVLQFDGFALKVHFLLYGTYEAEVEGVLVTGDYRRTRVPRLMLGFRNGSLSMFNCSVKIIEDGHLKGTYDFSVDIMSRSWDPRQALANAKTFPDEQIADVLLDQNVFAGVGNIIKNEVLSMAHVLPTARVADLSAGELRNVIALARSFSGQFLKWRRKFVLRKNLKVHGRSTCPFCSGRLTRRKTGKRARWSYYCTRCQHG